MSYLTASLQTSLLTSLLATAVFSATDTFQQDLESGIKLYQAGKYTEAEPKFRSAVEQAAELDPVDPRIARAWNNLAATIYALGRYDEAGQYYRKVLDWHDVHGMKTTLEYAKILNNVASMYRMTARFDEAAGVAARAVAIGEKVASPGDGRASCTTAPRSSAGGAISLLRKRWQRGRSPSPSARARTRSLLRTFCSLSPCCG
jgi:tetratricopeptide (TPR) repeat protein